MIHPKKNLIKKNYDFIYPLLDEIIVIINPRDNFTILDFNDNVLNKKLGYEAEEILYHSFFEFVHPDDLNQLMNHFEKPGQSKKSEGIIRLLSKKKKIIFTTLKVSEINQVEKQGRENLLLVLRTLSLEKKIEKQLQKTRQDYKDLTSTTREIKFWKFSTEKRYEDVIQSAFNMLEMVINTIPQYIFWKDINLNYLGCNQNYAQLIGLTDPVEIINKTDKELLWNASKNIELKKKERNIIKNDSKSIHVEELWPNRNGEMRWLDVNRIPFHDKNNNVVGILCTYDDITERKEAEIQIGESEQRYRDLTELLPDIIYEADLNFTLTYVNAVAYEKTGYSEEDFKRGLNINQFLTDESRNKALDNLSKLHLGFAPGANHYKVKKKDGSTFHAIIHSRPIFQGDKVIGIRGTITDVSDVIDAEQKIKESEEKFKDLFENSPFSIVIFDLEGNILDCNPATETLFEYKTSELIGQHFRDLDVYKEKVQEIEKFYQNLLADKPSPLLELKGVKRRGDIFYFTANLSKITIGNNQYIQGMFYDITEKKIYEDLIYRINMSFLEYATDFKENIISLLKTCEDLLKAELILFSFKGINEEEGVFFVFSSKGEYLRYSEEEFKDQIFCSEFYILHNDYPQTYLDLNKSRFSESDPFIKKLQIQGCTGRLIKSENDYNSSLCAFFKQNPILTYQSNMVITLISDAIETERQRWQLNHQLEVQNKRLNEINKIKTELLSRTSHELKTPLISIKGFSELLLRDYSKDLAPNLLSILDEIKNGTIRLEKIVNSLLEASQLEQGLVQLKKGNENLSFLIKFAVKELRGLSELRKHSFEIDIPEEIIVIIDKERIYEVIQNLLVNAIKYSPPEHKTSIIAEISENEIIICVKDSGIGFTPEEKKILFTQFGKIERYGQGFDVMTEGTGLGLYIAKEIIELHNGKIWVVSEGRAKGSTFFISLPV